MRGERGQATVEWLALVLLAALALGAAAAVATRREERGLGDVLAQRIVHPAGAPGPDARASAVRAPASVPRAPASAPPPLRAADAFQRLRGVGTVARHAWIVCLGYRRWSYELEHPRSPTEALPVREALAILNDCLNPYAFLTDE